MKRSTVIYGILLIAALAASSCLRDLTPAEPASGPALSVRPEIFRGESPLATKVADTTSVIHTGDEVDARDEYRENFFGSLDIFVKKQADAPGSSWFKQYHLNAGDAGVIVDRTKYDSESLLDQAKQVLASNWAEQGYEPDTPYDIYVTANNPHTAASSAPANLTALRALTTQSTDIYRYWLNYEPPQTDPNYWTNAMWSEKKSFLMDGSIEGWTIEANSSEQVFDVDLKRAAAKIIVNVSFSDEKTMLKVAEATPTNPNPTPELDGDGRAIYCDIQEYMQYVGRTAGEPRWKHVNFNLTGADIAYSGSTAPTGGTLDIGSSNFTATNLGNSTDNTENTFTFTTYTYPVDWSSDNSRIPYILLSVFYTRASDGDQMRSYYRIPVCDESAVTSLERNHIYIVDAKIGSLGASNDSFDAQDEQLRIEYHVIPWTETNMSQEATTVKIRDTKYLTIIPTEYILKGDGVQSVDLQWYASVSTDDNRIVDIDPSSLRVSYVNYLGATTYIEGTVTKQVRNDGGTLVTATDANTDGKRDIVITSTAPSGTGAAAAGETVEITLTPGGIIMVKSQALASRAIKDIHFTVYLKNATGVDPVNIYVRHFPLDNIQSIEGEWSSRWNESYTSTTVNEYSYDPDGDGWSSYDNWEWEECTRAQYDATPAADRKTESVPETSTTLPSGVTQYTTALVWQSCTQSEWAQGVGITSNDNRKNANSQANAINGYYATGSSTTSFNYTTNRNSIPVDNVVYTWSANGTQITFSGTRSGTSYSFTENATRNNTLYDYVSAYSVSNATSTTRRSASITLVKYSNYYHQVTEYTYNRTAYYRKKFSRQVSAQLPSTGSWVEWGGSDGTTSEGIYYAKVYYNGMCYAISDHDSRGSSYTNLTNNHMYVVQITSTSNKYVLGRPVLDSNFQSQDKVVSPAFMIASQLGAVNPTTSNTTASTHCGTYMEVGMDGTRYVGWRLPTQQEIDVIIDYQSGTYTNKVTMVVVLGGQYYWALDGNTAYVSGGSGGSTTNGYVRCVRDMTLAEINKLNQTGD